MMKRKVHLAEGQLRELRGGRAGGRLQALRSGRAEGRGDRAEKGEVFGLKVSSSLSEK